MSKDEELIARVEAFAAGLNKPAHPDDLQLGKDIRAVCALARRPAGAVDEGAVERATETFLNSPVLGFGFTEASVRMAIRAGADSQKESPE